MNKNEFSQKACSSGQDGWTLEELKYISNYLGLPVYGSKEQLCKRINDFYDSQHREGQRQIVAEMSADLNNMETENHGLILEDLARKTKSGKKVFDIDWPVGFLEYMTRHNNDQNLISFIDSLVQALGDMRFHDYYVYQVGTNVLRFDFEFQKIIADLLVDYTGQDFLGEFAKAFKVMLSKIDISHFDEAIRAFEKLFLYLSQTYNWPTNPTYILLDVYDYMKRELGYIYMANSSKGREKKRHSSDDDENERGSKRRANDEY